jgi:hypothetical protein
MTGGQMWSLVSEDGNGTDNRTEKLPSTIDPQYMVGFSWARQHCIRLQQRFGRGETRAIILAVSAEQAQVTNFTASGQIPTEFFFGGVRQNGGLYNAAGITARSMRQRVRYSIADTPTFSLNRQANFDRDTAATSASH